MPQTEEDHSIKVSHETYVFLRQIAEKEDRLMKTVVDRAVREYAAKAKRK